MFQEKDKPERESPGQVSPVNLSTLKTNCRTLRTVPKGRQRISRPHLDQSPVVPRTPAECFGGNKEKVEGNLWISTLQEAQ